MKEGVVRPGGRNNLRCGFFRTHSVRRRETLTPAERTKFERAVEWARMGTNDGEGAEVVSLDAARRAEKPGATQAVSADALS